VYRAEHVVIGPANHGYDWVALVEEDCTARALRESDPTPNRGSRKEVANWEWFAEPTKNKLACLDLRQAVLKTIYFS